MRILTEYLICNIHEDFSEKFFFLFLLLLEDKTIGLI